MTAFPTVQGKCPACGGTSLFLGSGGYVTCSRIDCPDPGAADDQLEQRTDPAKYWLNIGDDNAVLYCRICEDGIFTESNDAYYHRVGAVPGLDELLAIARKHYTDYHQEQP